MKMLYVPADLLQAFRAARLEGDEYLDVLHLLNIVSPEDVAFYLFLNAYPGKVLSPEIQSSFENVLITQVYGAEQQKLSASDYRSHLTAGRIVIDDGYNRNIQRHLLEYVTTMSPPQLDLDGKVPSCEILWTSGFPTILFTHVPRHEISSEVELTAEEIQVMETHAFYDRLLTQLSQYLTTDRIAAYPVFTAYLKSLGSVVKAA